ncbi:MAG TPA: BON domain-containing protein [Arachidicoccus sp.]|nr:BON domain-containing protein [Arachidicoccus sp.]
MLLKKVLPAILLASALAFALPSCKSKPSDADVQAKVASAIAATPGVSAEVKEGVVTLTGIVGSPEEKASVETAVNNLKTEGVKSVVDNIEVEAPPAPTASTAVDALSAGVTDATKDFPGVTATVSNGVITVTGEIEQSKIKTLKSALDALNPKKVDLSQVKIK